MGLRLVSDDLPTETSLAFTRAEQLRALADDPARMSRTMYEYAAGCLDAAIAAKKDAEKVNELAQAIVVDFRSPGGAVATDVGNMLSKTGRERLERLSKITHIQTSLHDRSTCQFRNALLAMQSAERFTRVAKEVLSTQPGEPPIEPDPELEQMLKESRQRGLRLVRKARKLHRQIDEMEPPTTPEAAAE
jgi:hypothetical protein